MGGDLAGVRLWAGELGALHERFVHRFNREEPRQSALAYMRGLVAPLERKNGWTLAEEAGHTGPDRIHRLLNRIEWGMSTGLCVMRVLLRGVWFLPWLLWVDGGQRGSRSPNRILNWFMARVQPRVPVPRTRPVGIFPSPSMCRPSMLRMPR